MFCFMWACIVAVVRKINLCYRTALAPLFLIEGTKLRILKTSFSDDLKIF